MTHAESDAFERAVPAVQAFCESVINYLTRVKNDRALQEQIIENMESNTSAIQAAADTLEALGDLQDEDEAYRVTNTRKEQIT